MVKIRLMRMGAKKRPFYRVVVADSRSPRDGRFIENIGKYHPLQHPSLIDIDQERAIHWLQNGAQPTEPVRNLLQKTGIWSKFTGEPPPPDMAGSSEAAEGSPEEGAAPRAGGEPGPTDEGGPSETGGEPAPSGEAEASSEEVVAQRAGGERASSEDDAEASQARGDERTEGP